MTAPAVGKTRSFFWLPQFSLRQLMFLTGLFAFGVPAVLNATFMSANATLGLMYLLLTIAILAAVYCEGALRAFWLGFAVFGWGFVIFTLYSLETLNWRAPGGTTFIHYLYDEVLPKTYVEGEPPVFTPRWPSRCQPSMRSLGWANRAEVVMNCPVCVVKPRASSACLARPSQTGETSAQSVPP